MGSVRGAFWGAWKGVKRRFGPSGGRERHGNPVGADTLHHSLRRYLTAGASGHWRLQTIGIDAITGPVLAGDVVSEQGKPPDFMIEVASPCAVRVDTGAQRDDLAALDVRSTGAATSAETILAQGPPATSCTATPTVRCRSTRAPVLARTGLPQEPPGASPAPGCDLLTDFSHSKRCARICVIF